MSAVFISCVLILAIIPFNLLHAEDNKNIITLSERLKIATENNRLVKIAFHEKDLSYEDTIIARLLTLYLHILTCLRQTNQDH